jgi:hypothetical protein
MQAVVTVVQELPVAQAATHSVATVVPAMTYLVAPELTAHLHVKQAAAVSTKTS